MKIKILDFATTGQGAERLLYTRVKKINQDSRFLNFIICPEGEEARRISDKGITVIPMKIVRGLGVINICKEIKSLYNILKEEKPQIIHTHNSKAGALGRIVCLFINLLSRDKIFVIHQVHGYHFTKLKGCKRLFFYMIEKLLSGVTDALLFQNKYEYKLSEKFKSKRTSLHLIGNGINFEEFSGKADKKPDVLTEKNIICIARIEPVKNHEMLIKAASLLKSRYGFNNFRLYLIGEGEINSLKRMAEQSGILEHIIFTGKVERSEIADYLSKADLSVLTSRKEGMPRSLIESMYFSIPCIGTDVVGTNEVIINDYNGFLVKLDDYNELADRMNFLFNDDDRRYFFGNNARNFCLNNFNEDIVINKLIKIYHNSTGTIHDKK